MKGIPVFVASGCILLALCGCGVNSATSNTTGAKPANQARTTVLKKTPVHQTKYQPIQIPKLSTTKYQTDIPVVLLPELVAVDTTSKPHPPKSVAVDIPSSLKGAFVAYFAYRVDPTHPLYIVLPKDMKPFGQNLVGADGSFYFDFKDSQGDIFEVGSSGPCYGCAADAGAPFFSAAEKAHEQDVPTKVPTLKSQGASVTYPQNNVALFAYSVKGTKIYGFDQYDTNMNRHYWGINFSASYSGKNPDTKQIPWVFQNLTEQNQQ